jgi:hypothetical protein
MAITSNTLIGKASGSIGGVTFSSWKGKNVAKSKPSSVANPNTAGQQTSRRKMSFIVAFYRMIAAVVNVGFLQMAVGKSAYNAFASTNLLNGAVTDNGTIASLVPENLLVAKGTLDQEQDFTILADASDNNISLDWSASASGNQLTTDNAYAVAFSATGEYLGALQGEDRRMDGGIGIAPVRPLVIGETIHVYLFFYQASTRKVSDSLHKSAIVVE